MPEPITAFAGSGVCIDSDGGQMNEKAGFAAIKLDGEYTTKKADSCDGEVLMEQYCDSATMVEKAVTCEYGCYRGACRPQTDSNATPGPSARRLSRNERIAARSTSARLRSPFTKQKQMYGSPSSGVRRNLSHIRRMQEEAHAVAEEKEEEKIEPVVVPRRCARLSPARRKRVRACNP